MQKASFNIEKEGIKRLIPFPETQMLIWDATIVSTLDKRQHVTRTCIYLSGGHSKSR